jgi:hypothetical protein
MPAVDEKRLRRLGIDETALKAAGVKLENAAVKCACGCGSRFSV